MDYGMDLFEERNSRFKQEIEKKSKRIDSLWKAIEDKTVEVLEGKLQNLTHQVNYAYNTMLERVLLACLGLERDFDKYRMRYNSDGESLPKPLREAVDKVLNSSIDEILTDQMVFKVKKEFVQAAKKRLAENFNRRFERLLAERAEKVVEEMAQTKVDEVLDKVFKHRDKKEEEAE